MKIVVFGDIALDVWLRGNPTRMAPEDPNALVYEMDGELECTLGMAGNVAHSLAVNGHDVALVGRVGYGQTGEAVLTLAQELGINTDWVLQDYGGTTQKIRGIGAVGKLVGRWDLDRDPAADCLEHRQDWSLSPPRERFWKDADAVIISDYDKGVFERDCWLFDGKPFLLPVIADMKYNPTRRSNVRVWYALPNAKEFHQRTGRHVGDEVSNDEIKNYLSPTAQLTKGIVITEGVLGATLLVPYGYAGSYVPDERSVHARSTCGAGDVFTAAFAFAIASGRYSEFDSMRYAVNAASHYAVTGDRKWPTL